MKSKFNLYTLGVLALLLSAVFWSTAYLFVKQILDTFSPYYLLSLRFLTAGILLMILFAKRLRGITKEVLRGGVIMGTALFFEFLTFTVGLRYTTASRSSFIVAGYIVILPFVYMLIRRKFPKKQEMLASFVCMVGIALILTGGEGSLNKGDIITSFCAVAYAVHIVFTGKYVKKQDGALLNVVQIMTAAILATVVALIVEPVPTSITGSQIRSILFLAVVSTIIPYFLSIFGQKYVKTTTSGIILSFESVFATFLSICFLGDKISVPFIIGGIIVIGAFFVSELGEKIGKGVET